MPDGVGDTTVNQTPTHPRSHAAHRTGRAIGWRKSHSQPGRPGGLPGAGNEEPERLQVEVGRCRAGRGHRREPMCPAFAQLLLFKWSLSGYFISLSFSFLIRKNRHNRTLTFPFVSTPKTVPGPFSHNLTKDHSSGQFPQTKLRVGCTHDSNSKLNLLHEAIALLSASFSSPSWPLVHSVLHSTSFYGAPLRAKHCTRCQGQENQPDTVPTLQELRALVIPCPQNNYL